MADGNYLGGFAGQVKQEERDIKDVPMARWEDVGRIRAQTWNMAGLRMWQIAALLFTALAWAYTISAYRNAEVVPNNDLTMILNIAFVLASLLMFAFVVLDVRREVVDSGAQWVVIGVASVILLGVVFAFVPVATWSVMNMFLIGYAPILQIVAAGWIPVVLSIVAASIVPDFQIGRFAWWRELTNQPEASSEKQVRDVTQIELEQMKIDWEREKADRTDNATLELELAQETIAALEARINELENLPPRVEYVVTENNGRTHRYNGYEFSHEKVNGKISDHDALIKYITEMESRGTSRANWVGSLQEQKDCSHISQQQWTMITKVLQSLKVLDDKNNTLMGREEAIKALNASNPTALP